MLTVNLEFVLNILYVLKIINVQRQELYQILISIVMGKAVRIKKTVSLISVIQITILIYALNLNAKIQSVKLDHYVLVITVYKILIAFLGFVTM